MGWMTEPMTIYVCLALICQTRGLFVWAARAFQTYLLPNACDAGRPAPFIAGITADCPEAVPESDFYRLFTSVRESTRHNCVHD